MEISYDSQYLSPSEQKQIMEHLNSLNYVPKIGPNPYNKKKLSISKNLYAWFSTDRKAIYAFSRNHYNPLQPRKLPEWLKELTTKIEQTTNKKFNSVLINFYPNGGAGLSAHSDDDPWLGEDFDVPSLSLGAQRKIVFKPKAANTPIPAWWGNKKKYEIVMVSGSLVLMKGKVTQNKFTHAIPEAKKILQPRFNLTFRNVLDDKRQAQFKKTGYHTHPAADKWEKKLVVNPSDSGHSYADFLKTRDTIMKDFSGFPKEEEKEEKKPKSKKKKKRKKSSKKGSLKKNSKKSKYEVKTSQQAKETNEYFKKHKS